MTRGLRAMRRDVLDAAGKFLIIEANGEFGLFTVKEFAYLPFRTAGTPN